MDEQDPCRVLVDVPPKSPLARGIALDCVPLEPSQYLQDPGSPNLITVVGESCARLRGASPPSLTVLEPCRFEL
ncbi:MAG: hypothetical protein QM756_29375 [Polyangiaceae bacterium]